MTTTAPRHPVARPLTLVGICLALLIGSGFLYSVTGWAWLGAVNLVLILAALAALFWTGAVAAVISAGVWRGKRLR